MSYQGLCSCIVKRICLKVCNFGIEEIEVGWGAFLFFLICPTELKGNAWEQYNAYFKSS